MVTPAQAAETYSKARAFYKGGAKASNKAYFATGEVSPDKIEIDEGQTLDEDQQKRNNQTLQNLKDMAGQGRSYEKNKGKSPYQAGSEFYNSKNTFGNCGEMAAVAVYIAVAIVHADPDEVEHWTLSNTQYGLLGWLGPARKFGHSFAVLGKGKDTERWVVDPWADLCCMLDKFADMLKFKLDAWTGQGKRIAAGGSWVEPTNALVTGILGRSAFDRVGAHEIPKQQ
jgi:hypothetical protein